MRPLRIRAFDVPRSSARSTQPLTEIPSRDALEFAEACCRAGLRAPLLQKVGEAAVMTTLADCTPAASAA